MAANKRRDRELVATLKDAAEQLNAALAACGNVGLETEVKVYGKRGDVLAVDVFVARPL